MSSNFVEELVREYYQTQGYLVASNYWFPIETTRTRTRAAKKEEYEAQSWSDIDVLAVGKNEIIIVQVKAIINDAKVADKVVQFFERASVYIKEENAWWSKGKAIKLILVYENYSSPKYLNSIEIRKVGKNNIETKLFVDYFEEILKYTQSKKGVKEGSPLMRMVHFLNKNYEISPLKRIKDKR